MTYGCVSVHAYLYSTDKHDPYVEHVIMPRWAEPQSSLFVCLFVCNAYLGMYLQLSTETCNTGRS